MLNTVPKSNKTYKAEIEPQAQPNFTSIFSNSGSNSIIPTIQVKNNIAQNIMNSLKPPSLFAEISTSSTWLGKVILSCFLLSFLAWAIL